MEDNDRRHDADAVIDNGTFGTRTIRFETGRLAQQAAGSAVAYLDDETMMLSATTRLASTPRTSFDFFPLTVDVEERMYAAGRIPGSFFRREGRPVRGRDPHLPADRPPAAPVLRQGPAQRDPGRHAPIMALNPDDLYDVLAINAASASTQLAGLPFSGPIGGVRVALIEGQWVAFPTPQRAARAPSSTWSSPAACSPDGDVAIMMVEAEATDEHHRAGRGRRRRRRPRRSWPQGLEAAKPFITRAVPGAGRAGRSGRQADRASSRSSWTTRTTSSRPSAPPSPTSWPPALTIAGKQEREAELDRLKGRAIGALAGAVRGPREGDLPRAYRSLTKKLVRQRVITRQGPHRRPRRHRHPHPVRRGRGRPAGARLGAVRARRDPDPGRHHAEHAPDGAAARHAVARRPRKRYMHNYNFPPYSTGETGRVGSPKRREIGHGALAERALVPVLPTREEFPYAIRQVSEALGSNGSTSMGSVCASTMSLLNAGVPLKAPVAGIAMGLISAGDRRRDRVRRADRHPRRRGRVRRHGLQGRRHQGVRHRAAARHQARRHPRRRCSARALKQARDARLHILDVMNEAIDGPDEMSEYAPRIITVKIPVDKIGEVIGPKGKMINQIQDDTGADITIEDDGTIYIGAADGPAAEAARATINAIANPTMPEVGERFLGTVVKTTDLRRVRLAAARQGRPAAHLADPQARRRQAGGERRGRGQGRRQGAGRDRRDRPARQALADPGGRGRGGRRGGRGAAPTERRGRSAWQPDRTSTAALRHGPYLCIAERRGRAQAAQQRPGTTGPLLRATTGRHRAPHRAARRPAGRHRDHADGALGGLRHLGGRRLARRDAGAGRRHALPGAPALQGHRRGAARWTSPPRSTRSAARSTPSPPRSTPATTRGCSTPTCRSPSTSSATWSTGSLIAPAGRRRRARRHPRRDRDDRGRPGRPGARRVRRSAICGDAPLGRPDLGTGETDQRADPRPDRRLLPAALHPAAPGRRGGRQPRPRRRSSSSVAAGLRPRRRSHTRRPRARPAERAPAARRDRAAHRPGRSRSLDRHDRAGPPGPRHARRLPRTTTGAGRSACSTRRSAAA